MYSILVYPCVKSKARHWTSLELSFSTMVLCSAGVGKGSPYGSLRCNGNQPVGHASNVLPTDAANLQQIQWQASAKENQHLKKLLMDNSRTNIEKKNNPNVCPWFNVHHQNHHRHSRHHHHYHHNFHSQSEA